MTNEDEAVKQATFNFYAAIEDLIAGRGLARMKEAWHHTPRVTGGHPSGEWAEGWEEVCATWEVFASFGRPDRGGSSVKSMKVHVYDDTAYATVLFVASPAWGGDTLACTNVLHKAGGAWRVVHHHADKSPAMGIALERIIAEGG